MGYRLAAMSGLALTFAFMNGANDSGTMAASVVSSRCLSPRRALALAALASFAGALLLGSAVAHTLGQGLVRLETLPPPDALAFACRAAAATALLWSLLGWRLGLPGSYTHALLGGWLGGFAGVAGPGVIDPGQVKRVLVAVFLGPMIGLLASWIAFRLLYKAGEHLSRHTLPLFRWAEAVTFGCLSFSHGGNAAQNSMAILVLGGLLASPSPEGFAIPLWVRLACAGAFSFGVLMGFTRTLKTLGFGIFRLETLHSFSALATSSAILFASTMLGFPMSPGQVNSSAILGTGAGHNFRAVRWDVASDILSNWVLTFPSCVALSYCLVKVVR